jgi:subtilase family serine protease
VDHELGDVISMSFGENEQCVEPALRRQWHRAFEDATRKNITLLAAAGDNGAAEPSCDNTSYQLAVALPAVDPLITAVGGTQLSANYPNGEYQNETAWNELQSQAASGGGFSAYVNKPSYQTGIASIGLRRGMPDVAYNAAFNGGIPVVWSDGPQGAGVKSFYIYYGTSAGTPQWAGLVALATSVAGKRLGQLNPLLYAIGQSDLYAQTFHDIQAGNNSVTMLNSSTSKKNVKVQGHNATAGWDAATGWGTPIAARLVPLLAQLAAIRQESILPGTAVLHHTDPST